MFKKLTYVLLLMLFTLSSSANDKKPLNESTVFNETFSWQGQVGLSLQQTNGIIAGIEQEQLGNYLNISLLFDFYYEGFFIQSDHRRAHTHTLGAELGYQLIIEDDWELDIISKSYIAGFYPDDIIDNADKEIPILEGLKNRSSGDGIGIRYSKYFENSTISLDVATLAPLSGSDGWIADLFYSHIVLYRNWDIYLNTGLTYYSDDVIDYYVGIDESETSALREEFTGHHSVKTQVEIFAQRPISKSWTFNVGLSLSHYFGDITDSPIVDRQNASQIMAGVLYVF